MEPYLVNLGRELARAQDEQVRGSVDMERGRALLLGSFTAKSRRPLVVALVAAAALTLALSFSLLRRDPVPLEYRVGGASESGRLQQPLLSSANEELKLAFSDGTELALLGQTEARVVSTDHRGATLRVERGTVRAAVAHRKDTQWQVRIGPFAIDVLGTRFETSWHAETQHFSLFLKEGSVSVSGPIVGTKRVVSAGETLDVSCREGELALLRARSDTVAAPPPAPAPPPTSSVATAEPAGERGTLASPPRASASTPEGFPDFRRLARSNQYALALDAAERAGFETICRTGKPLDLLLLGDTARLAGNARRAEQAYQSVRARFGGSDAAQAAFLLGRLAFDERGAFAEAARYFALTLLEEPSGAFSREAAGRLVESLDRSGDVTGARAAAQRYLERHPDGPHAKLSRALLARP
jgi:transmembrane sensor